MVELLNAKRVLSFHQVREEEVANMVETISKSSTATVHLSEIILNLLANLMSRVAMGKNYVENYGDGKKLAMEINELFGCFSVGDYFPWLGWIDVITGLDARIKRNARGFDAFLDLVIEDHLSRRVPTDGEDGKMDGDFVDLLLQVQMNSTLDIPFTQDNLKAIILDMYAAGVDTTYATIEWAMAELMKHPKLMKKAQKEIREIVGKKQKVEEEDLQQMNYLKCIIKETLRLHPPAPLLVPHESTKNTKVHGYHVPSKTRVLINAWAIGRDPKSWENAESFLPERFLNNPVDYKGQDFEFIPFGAGRRGCPGLVFAIATAELAIANLLYWFDWELPGNSRKEEIDMSEASGIAIHKKSPLLLVPIQHFC